MFQPLGYCSQHCTVLYIFFCICIYLFISYILEEHDVQYAQDSSQQMGGDIVVVFQDDNEASKIERQQELAKKRQVFFLKKFIFNGVHLGK